MPQPWLGADRVESGLSLRHRDGKEEGAGLLRQPELLRQLLDGIFDALPDMKISVKTRIGWERAEEWPALLALLETYLSAA